MSRKSRAGSVHNKIRAFYRIKRLFHKLRIFFSQAEHTLHEIKTRLIVCDQILHDVIRIGIKLYESNAFVLYEWSEGFRCQYPEFMPSSCHFLAEFSQRVHIPSGSDRNSCDDHVIRTSSLYLILLKTNK